MSDEEDQSSLLKRGIFGRFTFNDSIFLLLTITGYVIVVVFIHPSMGIGTPILVTLPIILYAWRWGTAAGIISGLLTVPINTVLLMLLREGDVTIIFRSWASALGSLLVVVIGGVVGHLKDLSKRSTYELEERIQIQELVNQQTVQLEAINEIGLELTAELDLDVLLHSIVVRSVELLDGTRGGLYLYRPDRDVLEFIVSTGVEPTPKGIVLQRGEGLSGKILETGEPIVVADFMTWEGRSDVWPDHTEHYSVVGVPIHAGDKLLGVLNVDSDRPDHFTQTSIETLTLFTNPAAIAIQNAELYEQAQKEIAHRIQTEEELQKVLKELERSNTELEQFAFVASHDLREPLRMILNFMGLLRKRSGDQLDEDAIEFIHFAIDGAERMQKLIDALLVYSHVGTQAKTFAPTDCDEVLSQALENLRLTIEECGAEIVADALPVVMADDVQLIQLFQNLVSNALKFQEDSHPIIRISINEDDDNYIFSIEDNGIGIEPENSTHIFEMSRRLHSQEEYPGAGIGLATCKKIVERHAGRIWVNSELGKGSTFFFTLPRPSDRESSVDLEDAPIGDIAGEAHLLEDES